jgi:GNAT superfamily N-acetyltransferase
VLWTERDAGLYIGRLAVLPDWRRRGLARALLARAEAEARARKLPRLHLGTRLALTNNRRLFAAAGFLETREHAHEGYDRPTWVQMEKRLD